jgi:NAD(P)-dependent dehydrogenase (short-subunit alcohol dehydrogenase family)
MAKPDSGYPYRRLDGKVAFITGGGRGVGRAAAIHLARMGADIAIVDIDLASARTVGEEIDFDTSIEEVKSLGRRCIGIEGNVMDEAVVKQAVKATFDEFGRIDILINNAGGVIGGGLASQITVDQWKDDFQLNVHSAFMCCREIIPHMKERGSGKVINISSTSGVRPMNVGLAGYSASKAAMHAMTRSLALETAHLDITVNTIALGDVDTYMFRWGAKDIMKEIMRDVPKRRLGTLEECCGTIEFLATDASGYVTGQTIVMDGGWVELNPNFGGGTFLEEKSI